MVLNPIYIKNKYLNTTFSLHKIITPNDFTFDPSEYSWFKFGDQYFAKKFAKELFDNFILNYQEKLLLQAEIIVLPSPYLSIPTASNFLCFYFMEYLNRFLYINNKKAVVESKIYRNQTYVNDYGNLSFSERLQLISNDTYYIDKEFIEGKFCIFLDDIKITGSHEKTVTKILSQNNIHGDFMFIYFAELINSKIHPSIENYFNYYAVKGVKEIIEVINRKEFRFNTRLIKYILVAKEEDVLLIINNIDFHKLSELFILAISNNYHLIESYNDNLLLINNLINKDLISDDIKL